MQYFNLSLLVSILLWIGYSYLKPYNVQPEACITIYLPTNAVKDTTDIVEEFMISKELAFIVNRESRGDTTVISSANCVGKYQLHPMYFRQLGINPFEYIVNGKFTANVSIQEKVCRHFIKEQIKYLNRNHYPVTFYNLYRSWEGTGYFVR